MITLGILGCAEIAYRRFMPAVQEIEEIKVVAIAEEYNPEKLACFTQEYNLETEKSFQDIICRKDIDAVYIPQPPALHFQWAKQALEHGKHVLIEKPSTTNYQQSKILVDLAREKGLVLHENYMFQYHSQIQNIKNIVQSGEIGELRLIRASFGFPLREKKDFRYIAELGGGSLLDAGGYPVKLATLFLGDTIKVDSAHLIKPTGWEVDMYGTASLSNDEGCVCQIGFGMDCFYQCCLEIWGSKGRLYTNRIFTAPPGYKPIVQIEKADGKKEITLSADLHFKHSIETFCQAVSDEVGRAKLYKEILLQAKLIDMIRQK